MKVRTEKRKEGRKNQGGNENRPEEVDSQPARPTYAAAFLRHYL